MIASSTTVNEPQVGQLWRWMGASSLDDGWWPLLAVTTKARTDAFAIFDNEFVYRDDVLLIVDIEDPGPARPVPLDDFGDVISCHWNVTYPCSYLVALLHDRLVWIKSEDLIVAGKLVGEKTW